MSTLVLQFPLQAPFSVLQGQVHCLKSRHHHVDFHAELSSRPSGLRSQCRPRHRRQQLCSLLPRLLAEIASSFGMGALVSYCRHELAFGASSFSWMMILHHIWLYEHVLVGKVERKAGHASFCLLTAYMEPDSSCSSRACRRGHAA